MLRRMRVRSMVVVPLRGRRGILGALALVQAESDRRYAPADVQLAEAVAARIAIALENARLYERERVDRGHAAAEPAAAAPACGAGCRDRAALLDRERHRARRRRLLRRGDRRPRLLGRARRRRVRQGHQRGRAHRRRAPDRPRRGAARGRAREVLAWLDDAIKDQSDQFGGQYCTAVYGAARTPARRLGVPVRARWPPAARARSPRAERPASSAARAACSALLDEPDLPRDRGRARSRRHAAALHRRRHRRRGSVRRSTTRVCSPSSPTRCVSPRTRP